MGLLGVIFHATGVSMGWLCTSSPSAPSPAFSSLYIPIVIFSPYSHLVTPSRSPSSSLTFSPALFADEFMGVLCGSAVPAIAAAIMSKRANKWACVSGTIIGLACGLIGWLVCTATLNDGVLNLSTTLQDFPMLTGNVLSCVISLPRLVVRASRS